MTTYLAIAKCYETHAIVNGAISKVMTTELCVDKTEIVFNLRIGRSILDAIQFDLMTSYEEKGHDLEISASVVNIMENIADEAKYWNP